IGRRATRGSKGLKQPASTIKEEAHETSSYEQQGEDVTMATEIAGTDDQDDVMEKSDAPAEGPDDEEDNVVGDLQSPEGEQTAIGLNDDDDDDDDLPVHAG